MQVYIVTGGQHRYIGSYKLAYTETLEKDGGSAWKLVADLPGPERNGARGLGLDNGRFIVTGQFNLCFICLEGLMLFFHIFFSKNKIINEE